MARFHFNNNVLWGTIRTKLNDMLTELYKFLPASPVSDEFVFPDIIYAIEGVKLPIVTDRLIVSNTNTRNIKFSIWNPVTLDTGIYHGNNGAIEQVLNGTMLIDLDPYEKFIEINALYDTFDIKQNIYKRIVLKKASLSSIASLAGNVCIIGDSTTTGEYLNMIKDRYTPLGDGSVTFNGGCMLGSRGYATVTGWVINTADEHPNYNIGDGATNLTGGRYLYPATAGDLATYPEYCFTGEVYGTPFVPYAKNRRYSEMSGTDRTTYEALAPTAGRPYQGKYYIFNIGQYFKDLNIYNDIANDIIKGMFIIQYGQNDYALDDLSVADVLNLQNFMIRKIDTDFGHGIVRIGVIPSYSDDARTNWTAWHAPFIKGTKRNCNTFTKSTVGYEDTMVLSSGWKYDGINANVIPTWVHQPLYSAFWKVFQDITPSTIPNDGSGALLDYNIMTNNDHNYNLHPSTDTLGFITSPVVNFIVNELV